MVNEYEVMVHLDQSDYSMEGYNMERDYFSKGFTHYELLERLAKVEEFLFNTETENMLNYSRVQSMLQHNDVQTKNYEVILKEYGDLKKSKVI